MEVQDHQEGREFNSVSRVLYFC